MSEVKEQRARVEDGAMTLTRRLERLHGQVREIHPTVKRMACALYDPGQDLLKTFVNSTDDGVALARYECELGRVPSLLTLALTHATRVVEDIPRDLRSGSAHTRWLLERGYQSSYTLPLYRNDSLLGFLFFDSTEPHGFPTSTRRELDLCAQVVALLLNVELTLLQTVIGAAHVARDFVDLRDLETGDHLERMARYARLIAQGLAESHGLSDEFVEHVFLFAPLHDIGKIGVPDRVLLKPGPLDGGEREEMCRHVEHGVRIVSRIIGDFRLRELPNMQALRNIVEFHHELLDGSGYARGLAGDAIPLEARIVTTADIFDALCSRRPYKPAWTVDDALAELGCMADAGKLDRACVEALASRLDTILDIRRRFPQADERVSAQ